MPNGLRSSTRSPDVRALRKLDGLDSGEETDPKDINQAATVDDVDDELQVVEEGEDSDVEDEKAENDLDPETQRNTQANESMTPRRRLLRRRASSKMNASHSSPDSGSGLSQSPPKHVEFADENQPARVLERHRKALRNPRTPEKRKEHARELLAFHGEACE